MTFWVNIRMSFLNEYWILFPIQDSTWAKSFVVMPNIAGNYLTIIFADMAAPDNALPRVSANIFPRISN